MKANRPRTYPQKATHSPGRDTHIQCVKAADLGRGKLGSGENWFTVVVIKLLNRGRLFATPWTAARQLLCPWDSPGKNTGVGSHCLLQGQSS